MSNLTISVDEDLKKQVIKKAKKDRMTVSFLVHQMFKNYLSDSFEVKIVPKNAMLESHNQVLAQIKSGKAKLYKSGKELIDDILSE
jgi:hypothetical protein